MRSIITPFRMVIIKSHKHKQQKLERVKREEIPPTLLVGVYIGKATMQSNMEVPKKYIELLYDSPIPLSQFSRSVVSNSLQLHGLQHTRLPCPSPTSGAYSNTCPLVSDAILTSHPLSSPSPPTFNLSQQQGLFQWVSSSHQVARVLEFQFQHQFFQWIFMTDFI